MDFNELIKELEKFKDTDEFRNYVGGLYTVDGVDKYLDSDEGKKFLQPILDKYHSKGLDTWKTNNLSNLVDEEIKKRFPEADPKDTEMKKLQSEIEKIKREATRKELTNKALKYSTEKKLPVDLIEYFIGEDEESTMENLKSFENVFNTSLQKVKEEYINQNKYSPNSNEKGENKYSVDDLNKLSTEEINKYFKTIKD